MGSSVGMRPCVLFVKINHLDKDIWREFILNSCKSKLLCVEWWCNGTTPRVWIWSPSRKRGIKKSELWLEARADASLRIRRGLPRWKGKKKTKKKPSEERWSVWRDPPADRLKWGGHQSAAGQTWVCRKEPLTSKAETLTPVAGTSQGADVEG